MVRRSGQAEVPVAKEKAKMVQQQYVGMFDYIQLRASSPGAKARFEKFLFTPLQTKVSHFHFLPKDVLNDIQLVCKVQICPNTSKYT